MSGLGSALIYSLKTREDIKKIKSLAEKILSPLGKKVYTIVNYDNYYIHPDLVDEYTEMVKGVVDRFYLGVTRYTTSTFLRMKLGDALQRRNLAPYIYEIFSRTGPASFRRLPDDTP